MEFNNSAFFAFLFKETKASPIAASSPELTCSDIDIIWELRENIIRIKRERERERETPNNSLIDAGLLPRLGMIFLRNLHITYSIFCIFRAIEEQVEVRVMTSSVSDKW